MKFVVNDSCIGCGLCNATCPEVFTMEGGTAHAPDGDVAPAAEASAREAMGACPVSAIEEA